MILTYFDFIPTFAPLQPVITLLELHLQVVAAQQMVVVDRRFKHLLGSIQASLINQHLFIRIKQ